MIKLANGAKVHNAVLFNFEESLRTTGMVLAETDTDFVTWNVWLADYTREIYEADSGHYFHKHGPMERGADRQLAEIDLGKRLALHIPMNVYEGLSQSCGGI